MDKRKHHNYVEFVKLTKRLLFLLNDYDKIRNTTVIRIFLNDCIIPNQNRVRHLNWKPLDVKELGGTV